MTIDDLEKVFWGDQREQPTRVRLARVVKALRGEFSKKADTWEPRWAQVEIDILFDEILGGSE
jgi:hypothetical protein